MCYSSATKNKERWLSGRKRLTANEVGINVPRGFKSHSLRNKNRPVSGVYFCCLVSWWDLNWGGFGNREVPTSVEGRLGRGGNPFPSAGEAEHSNSRAPTLSANIKRRHQGLCFIFWIESWSLSGDGSVFSPTFDFLDYISYNRTRTNCLSNTSLERWLSGLRRRS